MRTASRVLILPLLASHALVTNSKPKGSVEQIEQMIGGDSFKQEDLEEILDREFGEQQEGQSNMLQDGGERIEELISAAGLVDQALEKYHPWFRKSGKDVKTKEMGRIRRACTRIIHELLDNDNDGVVTWHEFLDSHTDVLEHFTYPHPVTVERLWSAWMGMVQEQLVGTTTLAERYAAATHKGKLTLAGLMRFESWMNPYALANRIDRILANYETKRCVDCEAAMAKEVNKYQAKLITEAALQKGTPEIFTGIPNKPGKGDWLNGDPNKKA